MVLIQGTTPTIIINIKNDINFSQIAGASLIISQRDKIRVHKDIADITVNPIERRIKVLLTQEDTLNLREGDAIIQVRILMSDGTALASIEKEIGVIKTQGGEISSEEYTPEQWTVGPEPTIERIRLNLIPVGAMPICHASQFDKKRQIEIELYNGAQPYFLSDEVLELDIKKPDGNLVTMNVPYDVGSNSVIFETTEQACAVAGKCLCELRVTKGEKDLGSLNFYLEVESSPSADGVPSGSEINNLHKQIEEITIEVIGENYYNKTQIDTALATKADVSAIPTKTSQLQNDSGFAQIDDTEASASKTYSSDKIDNLLDDKASANWKKQEKFDGTYTHWGYDSNLKMFEDPNRETAVIPMVDGASYHINVTGTFNRFLVFTSNNLGYGYDVTRIISTTSPQSHEEYTYTNEANAKYLLITLNYGESEFDCDLSVEETITDGTNTFNVNGISVLVSDKLNDYLATITDNNYLKDADVEYTNNCLNRGQITTDVGKLAIVTMKNALKYIINISGVINRFVIAGANAKTIGTTYTIIYNSSISTAANRTINYIYENTNNYKYLLIFYYYGTPTDPISLGIQELSYNGKMTVSGIEVALKEELPKTYDNYMSDLSVDSVASASDLYALYDALVTAYPDYISKNTLGQDSVNNNIVEYVLTSGNYNSQTGQRTEDTEITKPKILIVTGVHGYERSSVMSTYQFVRDLCNAVPKITDIRENHIIKVVPCACPSGFNADTRANSNGVNINRNFADNWTYTGAGTDNYSGASAADQLETQIIQNWIDANDDAVLYVDFHNSGFDNEVSYIQGSNTYAGMSDIKGGYLKQVYMTSAYWKEIEAFASNLIFAYTGGEDQIASSNCYAHITGGLLSILLETSWNQNGTGKHSKMTIKTGAEALGNMLIGVLGEI